MTIHFLCSLSPVAVIKTAVSLGWNGLLSFPSFICVSEPKGSIIPWFNIVVNEKTHSVLGRLILVSLSSSIAIHSNSFFQQACIESLLWVSFGGYKDE